MGEVVDEKDIQDRQGLQTCLRLGKCIVLRKWSHLWPEYLVSPCNTAPLFGLFYFGLLPGIDLGPLHMLCKCSTTERHPQGALDIIE